MLHRLQRLEKSCRVGLKRPLLSWFETTTSLIREGGGLGGYPKLLIGAWSQGTASTAPGSWGPITAHQYINEEAPKYNL
jgi:hypothetical protein